MNDLAQLQQAKANLLTKLVEYSANPKPDYDIEGQKVSASQYLKMLTDGVDEINKLILNLDVYEIRTRAL